MKVRPAAKWSMPPPVRAFTVDSISYKGDIALSFYMPISELFVILRIII